MRLIDADRLLDRCIFYHLPNGDLAVPIIDVQHAPTVEAPDINAGNMDTTTHDSIPAETGKNDGDRTSGDCISRQAAIDALEQIFDRCEEIEAHLPEGDPDRTGYKMYPDYMTVWKYLHQLPSAQPERKDALEKAVAVEAICDELMSRFDISATYAYEIAEKAMNRIEAMATEIGKR